MVHPNPAPAAMIQRPGPLASAKSQKCCDRGCGALQGHPPVVQGPRAVPLCQAGHGAGRQQVQGHHQHLEDLAVAVGSNNVALITYTCTCLHVHPPSYSYKKSDKKPDKKERQ